MYSTEQCCPDLKIVAIRHIDLVKFFTTTLSKLYWWNSQSASHFCIKTHYAAYLWVVSRHKQNMRQLMISLCNTDKHYMFMTLACWTTNLVNILRVSLRKNRHKGISEKLGSCMKLWGWATLSDCNSCWEIYSLRYWIRPKHLHICTKSTNFNLNWEGTQWSYKDNVISVKF